jgi:hypothetical protein
MEICVIYNAEMVVRGERTLITDLASRMEMINPTLWIYG